MNGIFKNYKKKLNLIPVVIVKRLRMIPEAFNLHFISLSSIDLKYKA